MAMLNLSKVLVLLSRILSAESCEALLIAVYELQADEVFIIGHHDCGMNSIDTDVIIEDMVARGIDKSLFKTLKYSGIDMKNWLARIR